MHPLDSARERLNRAEENIQKFNSEITDFLAPIPAIVVDVDVATGKPILTDEYWKACEKHSELLKEHPVEPRFGVLAGEIIHHFRAAFDHLAWQLSSPNLQTKSPSQIEFPVFREMPESCAAKHKLCRYCRKVEGISSPSALARIEGLQPYHRSDPTLHQLWRIHDMDRIDKHRELVLTVYILQVELWADVRVPALAEINLWESKPRYVILDGTPANVVVKANFTPQVMLGETRGRKPEPIIPTLHELLGFSRNAVESFAVEFD